jgi:hypothetical protein
VQGVPPTLQEVQVAQETRAPQEEEREAQYQGQDCTVLKMQGTQAMQELQAQHQRVQESQEHVQEQVQAQETQIHEQEQQQETTEQETQDQGHHQDQEQQKPRTTEVLGEKELQARMTNIRHKIAEYQMILETRATNLEHRQNQLLQQLQEKPEAQELQELMQEYEELQIFQNDLNEMKVKNNEDNVLSQELIRVLFQKMTEADAVAFLEEEGPVMPQLPLSAAATRGDLAEADRLLALGFSISERVASGSKHSMCVEFTPLLCGAMNGHKHIVEWALQAGASIAEKNAGGMSALMLSLLHGHMDLAHWLLSAGASIAEVADVQGDFFLQCCRLASAEAVQIVLSGGYGSITDVDDEGWTPLLYAASEGNVDVCRFLLNEGATLTEADEGGNNVLLRAVRNGRPRLAAWLLTEGGASLECKNIEGESAWDSLVQPHNKGMDEADLSHLLRVMLLMGDAPAHFVDTLSPALQALVLQGGRLRARLPAYLVRRQALLDTHCPMLLPQLRDLVHGYMELTTTDELWATGLGAEP